MRLNAMQKLDNLSDQEINSRLQMLEVEKKSLEDPLVSLLTSKGKVWFSKIVQLQRALSLDDFKC